MVASQKDVQCHLILYVEHILAKGLQILKVKGTTHTPASIHPHNYSLSVLLCRSRSWDIIMQYFHKDEQ